MDESTHQVSGMRAILKLADKLNLADLLAPVRAELTKIDLIDRHVADAAQLGKDAHTRAVNALTAGNAPDPADLAAVLTFAPGQRPDGPYPTALASIKLRARSAVHQTAWTFGLGVADALHARIVELANGAVAVARKAKLPADATEENALYRDPATAAAYVKVTQAHGLYSDAHQMGSLLRKVQWLAPLGEVPGLYVVYKHPRKRLTGWQIVAGDGVVLLSAAQTDNVMATAARQTFAAPLAFWHAIRVGAQPGLYDVGDAEKRYLADLDGAPESELNHLRQSFETAATKRAARSKR